MITVAYSKQRETMKERGFYHTSAWRRTRRLALQRDKYLCQKCLNARRFVTATTVHHLQPLEHRPELALVLENLQSLCHKCHEETKVRTVRGFPEGVRVIRISNGEDTEGEA